MGMGLLSESLLILVWFILDGIINRKSQITWKFNLGWCFLTGVILSLAETTQADIPFWREILLLLGLLVSGSLIHRGIIEATAKSTRK